MLVFGWKFYSWGIWICNHYIDSEEPQSIQWVFGTGKVNKKETRYPFQGEKALPINRQIRLYSCRVLHACAHTEATSTFSHGALWRTWIFRTAISGICGSEHSAIFRQLLINYFLFLPLWLSEKNPFIDWLSILLKTISKGASSGVRLTSLL